MTDDGQAKRDHHFAEIRKHSEELHEMRDELARWNPDSDPTHNDLEIMWSIREALNRSLEKDRLHSELDEATEFVESQLHEDPHAKNAELTPPTALNEEEMKIESDLTSEPVIESEDDEFHLTEFLLSELPNELLTDRKKEKLEDAERSV